MLRPPLAAGGLLFLPALWFAPVWAARSLTRDPAAGPIEKQRMKGILPTQPMFDRTGQRVVHEGRVSMV
jgi:hypothetical protein